MGSPVIKRKLEERVNIEKQEPKKHNVFGSKDDNFIAGSNLGTLQSVQGSVEVEAAEGNRETYRIPIHAGWFSWGAIHTIEKRALPEFFDGKTQSKTSKIYKDYRDAIITKYREKPDKSLTFTEARRYLVGDVNALRRIFEFLEHWGLINHHSKDKPSPAWAGPPVALLETEPPGLRVVRPAITPSQALLGSQSIAPVAGLSAAPVSSGVEKKPQQYHCNSCGADCSPARYHSTKQVDYDICAKCHSEGKLRPGSVPGDFILLSGPSLAGGAEALDGQWTDQESLLLLEALEIYGDKWEEVAEHVGTKSKAQCVMHFLQMPVEDPFLEDLAAGKHKTAASQDMPKVPLQGSDKSLEDEQGRQKELEGRLPFADAGNPVMAQVAFLASMVGAPVAAAAAKAALEALTKEDDTSTQETSAQGSQLGSSEKEGFLQPKSEVEAMQGEVSGIFTGGKENGGTKSDPNMSTSKVRAAAAVALSAAAVKAKLLADEELRKMQTLVSRIIENQIKKVDIKLQHFEALEQMLVKEREQVERQRQQVHLERIQLASQVTNSSGTPGGASVLTTPVPSGPAQVPGQPPPGQ